MKKLMSEELLMFIKMQNNLIALSFIRDMAKIGYTSPGVINWLIQNNQIRKIKK